MKLFHICVIFLIGEFYAQETNVGGPMNTPSLGIVDGVYIQEHIPSKRLIQYEFVRESDVMFQKRVWRTIDLREKINHTLYFPHDDFTPQGDWVKHTNRWSLWTVLKTHILKADIQMFYNINPDYLTGEPDGDLFKYPVPGPATGKSFLTDPVYAKSCLTLLGSIKIKKDDNGVPIPLSDSKGNPIMIDDPDNPGVQMSKPDVDTTWIKSKDIVEYRIKEDWFFDKERSQFDCRILGIAPVVYFDQKNNSFVSLEEADKEGVNITGKKILFWMYFPHIRLFLNNYNVYNQKNDANWMSFDDLFQKRMFSSTIYKQSNIYDRSLDSYKSGIEALYESQRITEELRNFEHDLWHF